MTALLVALGAAVAAPLRYLVDRAVQARHDSMFPWGTWFVNVVGCFVAGMVAIGLAEHGVPVEVVALVSTGFCGTLTTYATFGYETARLIEARSWFYAAANVVASVVAGLGAALCGVAVAAAVWS